MVIVEDVIVGGLADIGPSIIDSFFYCFYIK